MEWVEKVLRGCVVDDGLEGAPSLQVHSLESRLVLLAANEAIERRRQFKPSGVGTQVVTRGSRNDELSSLCSPIEESIFDVLGQLRGQRKGRDNAARSEFARDTKVARELVKGHIGKRRVDCLTQRLRRRDERHRHRRTKRPALGSRHMQRHEFIGQGQ